MVEHSPLPEASTKATDGVPYIPLSAAFPQLHPSAGGAAQAHPPTPPAFCISLVIKGKNTHFCCPQRKGSCGVSERGAGRRPQVRVPRAAASTARPQPVWLVSEARSGASLTQKMRHKITSFKKALQVCASSPHCPARPFQGEQRGRPWSELGRRCTRSLSALLAVLGMLRPSWACEEKLGSFLCLKGRKRNAQSRSSSWDTDKAAMHHGHGRADSTHPALYVPSVVEFQCKPTL